LNPNSLSSSVSEEQKSAFGDLEEESYASEDKVEEEKEVDLLTRYERLENLIEGKAKPEDLHKPIEPE